MKFKLYFVFALLFSTLLANAQDSVVNYNNANIRNAGRYNPIIPAKHARINELMYGECRRLGSVVGEIKMYAGNTAPQGWLMCQGQVLTISQYPELFAVVGSVYGGNGTTTFALPDMRGRFPLGASASRSIGTTGGAETVSLTEAQLPAHTHAIQGEVKVGVADQEGNASAAPNSVLGSRALETSLSPPTRIEVYVPGGGATFNSGNKLGAVSHNLTAASVGSNTAVGIMPPFLSISYMICAGR